MNKEMTILNVQKTWGEVEVSFMFKDENFTATYKFLTSNIKEIEFYTNNIGRTVLAIAPRNFIEKI